MWNTFVECMDADLETMNGQVDYHHQLLDNNLHFQLKAKELIGRYKSRFEVMEEALVEKLIHIELLEISLAELTSRVKVMEGKLCRCNEEESSQEVQEEEV